jgi:membrane peptidoglycan carboxypeptidase
VRRLRLLLVLLVLTGYDAAGALVALDQLPYPAAAATPQVTVVAYRDGTPLATVGAEHRIAVPLARVPLVTRHAVLAAENRHFYADPGVSVSGLVRSAVHNLRGGPTQGGSTITQQYAKNAYLSPDRTPARKAQEAALALKLARDRSKDAVLEAYLNTIWFGRGAYGIEAAAWTYFGHGADTLTAAESAVLAGGIRSPLAYDPQLHPAAARARWATVLDAMAAAGWLPDRSATRWPRLLPRGAGLFAANAGPAGLVLARVRAELRAAGFDPGRLDREPLRVRTTLDRGAQEAAVRSAPRSGVLRTAVVALDPGTGAVRAWYGGADGVGLDHVRVWRPAGSTMKPFAVAAAREAGVPLEATFNGRSPRSFYGSPRPVRNDEDAQCPVCSIPEATTRSINTAFFSLVRRVGPRRVADVAHRLGIPPRGPTGPTLQDRNGSVPDQIVLGPYDVRPLDLAVAYASLAAGGVRSTPYLVDSVVDADGRVVFRHRPAPRRRVVAAGVARDVATAMAGVPAYVGRPLAHGRPAAAKTGTVQGRGADNKDAWMAGFTPGLATVVWVGTDTSAPIRDARGRPIAGAGLPAAIWQRVTDAGLDPQKREDAFWTVS